MPTLLSDHEVEATAETQLAPTRLFSCSVAERTRVATTLGRPSTTSAELRAAVAGAIVQAQREARSVGVLLRARPRGARTTFVFRSVFGVPPTYVPSWRPADASWADLGDLVALRLERAARILAGGHMRIFCWGSVAHCPECTQPPTRYRACSSYQGRYHICLGEPWWRWLREGRRGFMASTLLHETLHIYFVLAHHRAAVGRPSTNNVYCYDTLVARLMRRSPKPGDADRCRDGQRPQPAALDRRSPRLSGETELPAPVRRLIRHGEEAAALAVALAGGEKDENALTNLLFHGRHPERDGASIDPASEPGHVREWLAIRDSLVRPMLRRMSVDRPAPGVARRGDPAALAHCPIDPYRYDGRGVKCSGRPQPGALALRDLLFETFGRRRAGIYNCRNVRGGSRLSLHAEGRAIDYFWNAHDPVERATGDRIVAWLLASDAAGNPHARARRLGVQEVIWNRQIWSAGRPADRAPHIPGATLRRYDGASPHTDHLHIGLNWAGAEMTTSYWRGC